MVKPVERMRHASLWGHVKLFSAFFRTNPYLRTIKSFWSKLNVEGLKSPRFWCAVQMKLSSVWHFTNWMCRLVNWNFSADIVEFCLTPNGLDGTYKPFRNCSALYNLYLQRPISDENRKLLLESKNPFRKDDKIWVCCPLPKKTSTTTSTTVAPSTTTDLPGNFPGALCVNIE